MKIENYKDNKDALRALTRQLMDYMARKEDDEPFNLALSGGETAKQMFALWADEYKDKIDWNNMRFFWVDERCVSPTDTESNFGHANKLLFEPLHIPREHIHRIHGEGEPGTEAMRYSRIVKEYLPRHGQFPLFRLYHLGDRRRFTYGVYLPRQSSLVDRQPQLCDIAASGNGTVPHHDDGPAYPERFAVAGPCIGQR